MRRLMEIMILCCLAAGSYLFRYPPETMPVYLLVSLGICVVMEISLLVDKGKHWHIFCLVCAIAIALAYPRFLVFLPLIMYSVFAVWGKAGYLLLLLYSAR